MSALLNSERGAFETAWEERLKGAYLEAPSGVWMSIAAGLDRAEAKKNRKAIIWYKWTAAASVAIAMVLAYLLYNQSSSPASEEQVVAEEIQGSEGDKHSKTNQQLMEDQMTASTEREEKTDDPNTSSIAQTEDAYVDNTDSGNDGNGTYTDNDNTETNTNLLAAGIESEESKQTPGGEDNEGKIRSVIKSDSRENRFTKKGNRMLLASFESKEVEATSEIPEMEKILYKVPVEDEDIVLARASGAQRGFWAGVNLGSGIYFPNSSGADAARLTTESFDDVASGNESFVLGTEVARDAVQSSTLISGEEGSGSIVSVGMNMGYQISRRWSLTSGLEFSRFNSSTSTNAIVDSNGERSVLHFSNLNEQSENTIVSPSGQIPLENDFEFISVPVKGGYAVVDRKLKLVLNAGISTDILLRNELSDESGNFSSETIGSGSNSAYKSYNFRGLTGVEIRYPFAKNYTFSLEPNYRFSLSDFTKEGFGVDSRPNLFGVNFGVRYNFK